MPLHFWQSYLACILQMEVASLLFWKVDKKSGSSFSTPKLMAPEDVFDNQPENEVIQWDIFILEICLWYSVLFFKFG